MNASEFFLRNAIKSLCVFHHQTSVIRQGTTLHVKVAKRDHGRVIGRGGQTVYSLRTLAELLESPMTLVIDDPEDDLAGDPAPPWAVEQVLSNGTLVIPDLSDSTFELSPVASGKAHLSWNATRIHNMQAVRAMHRVLLSVAIVRGNNTFVEVLE
jgi:predicted RNA-binding protein YlqC (UPF0109 family)